MDDKENLLDQYKQALRSHDFEPTGVTIDIGITAQSAEDTVSLWDSTVLGATGSSNGLYIDDSMLLPNMNTTLQCPNVYITNAGTSINQTNIAFPWSDLTINSAKPSGTISLRGEDADIDINGESLMTMIRGIQDRLNILCPDPEMETEWDELRELRQQYDAKLQECREKSKMWKTLTSMPPPEVK